MSYPLPPEIATSYSGAEQALGDGSLPGQELDVDFAAVRASITSAIEFLKGITRSDGKLANGIVTQESLAAELIIGFDTPTIWATGTDYTTSSLVFEGVKLYIALVGHTSGTFATDLASGRWGLLADLTPPGGALIAANNLGDLTDVGNARANLGLGSMATASSGTGAAEHRTNLQNDAVYGAHTVPTGGIIMWSGAVVAIPAGWALCDGTAGTPDLRGRFVVGAGGAYAVGATGGADTVALSGAQLPGHTHSVSLSTDSQGAHTHPYNLESEWTAVARSGSVTYAYNSPNSTQTQFNTGSSGAHAHNVTGNTGSTGSGSAHENRPPYYALAYIMKT
jgi:microcystin-dependent protein